MVLFDTSAWVHYFHHGGLNFDQIKAVAVCPPVVQEVLQGIKHPAHWRLAYDGLNSMPCFSSPAPLEMYIRASEIFREGRRKGYTIRSSIDCLIAAMAIEAGVPVHHFDRDFDTIARFTPLQIAPTPSGG